MSDCPVPVKTDVGQVDLVSRLSDGTSEKKRCCFVIFMDINYVNNYFNVFKNIGFHWSTLSLLIITVNQEIFRTYTWSISFQRFDLTTTGIKGILSTKTVICSYPKLLSFSVLTFIKWRLNTKLLANTLRNVVFSI